MNIIITGADGFVGTNLCIKLKKTRHRLLLIGKDIHKLQEISNNPQDCYNYEDLAQLQMKDLFESFMPESFIHLAAYSTASDEYADMELLINANISYLAKVLDALKNTGLKTFIYTGSFAEFYKGDSVFDPAYLYTATKTAGRSIVKYYSETYNFKFLSICPYTVYGGIDTSKKIIDFLYDSLGDVSPTDITSGEQILDFIHVFDLANLYITVVEENNKVPNGSIFYAGTGTGHTLKDLVDFLEKESGLKTNLNWGGRNYRKRDVMYAVADITLQKDLFKWKPRISLEQGVKLYLSTKFMNKS